MRQRTRLAVAGLLIAAVAAFAPASVAQLLPHPNGLPQPGDLGVYFDPQGWYPIRTGLGPFVLFDIYVIAFDVPGGMQGYEFSLPLRPGLVVGAGRQLPPGATDSAVGDDNWIVATGGECLGGSGPFTLVKYAGAVFLSAVNLEEVICLGAATPSRFAPGVPGYEACGPGGTLHPFGAAYTGCALINPSPWYPGTCNPRFQHLTLALQDVEAAAGSTASMPVHSIPLIRSYCLPKDAASGYLVRRVELDLAWDASVATLSGARWVDDGQGTPVITLTQGVGTATVSLYRETPPLYDPISEQTLCWLDFATNAQAGETAVTVTRVVAQGNLASNGVSVGKTDGSIRTGAVASATQSFGALKATWAEDR